MTLVIDNCLPVSWVAYLHGHGHAARHWRELGPANAPDAEIMRWAHEKCGGGANAGSGFHQVAVSDQALLPSVIQLRLDDVRSGNIGEDVLLVLVQHQQELRRGALITIKGHKSRLRILPLQD